MIKVNSTRRCAGMRIEMMERYNGENKKTKKEKKEEG
jgi:hypothetical protein